MKLPSPAVTGPRPPKPRDKCSTHFEGAKQKDSKMKVRAFVNLRSSILDPQGEAIHHALKTLGFDTVENVRQGKVFDLILSETDEKKAYADVVKMCDELLANTVIEDYEVEIVKSG